MRKVESYAKLLSFSAWQALAPARGIREDVDELLAPRKIAPQILQNGDQRVERRADFIGIGRGDVFPDVGRTGRESGRIREPFSREGQPVLADRLANDVH